MQLLQRAVPDGRGARGPPLSPASRGCAAPQVANQPEQHADLWGAAHEAADGRESVGALVVGMFPWGYTSPRRARRLGCARESASSAEQQGRTSSSCLSLRQCRSAGPGLGAAAVEHRLWLHRLILGGKASFPGCPVSPGAAPKDG